MDEGVERNSLLNRCPECERDIDVSSLPPFAKIECPHCSSMVRVRTTMGQYQIVQLLGEGGMSQVFKAVDLHLRREVALKILHQALSRDETLTSMFEREAKLTASVLHPNVVKVYKVGNDQGYFFIAMELVETTSLEQLIAGNGALPEQDVLSIAHDVTSGLRAANEEGLIHRDIKPGNMLVTAEGTTKLVDFGLAVQQGGADEAEDLWATPFYVPPEKLDGEPDTYLGDIYSLGATLYHALAGKPPFEANTSSLDELKLIKQNPVDLKSEAPSVSKPTVKLVEKMMAYRPEDRHQSYSDLLDDIEEIQRRVFGVKPVRRAKRGKGKLALLGGIAALVFLGIGLGVFLVQREENVSEEDFGLGSGERVISRGENRNAEMFLKGRRELAAGNLDAAAQAFSTLGEKDSLSPLTETWTHYFDGLIALLQGREKDSRESFRKALEVDRADLGSTDAVDTAEEKAVLGFLAKSAIALSSPLPVLDRPSDFSADSVDAIALLASGLKNWQLGEFSSGIEFLEAFSKSSIPEEVRWMEGFKKQIEPYLTDYRLYQQLPNPSRKASGDLMEEKKELTAAGEKVKTRHALPHLIKERLNRIDSISVLIAEEQAAAAMKPEPVVMNDKPDTAEKPVPDAGPGDAALAERDRLKALIGEQGVAVDSLKFPEVAARLSAEPLETDFGKSLRDQMVYAYTRADEYRTLLANRLASEGYEGIVRRREGQPLDASITAATPSVFTVDLGFGPNEVEVEKFASDWMVEAGEEIFPPVSETSASAWESMAFFALATGQRDTFERLASRIASQSPEFANRLGTISEWK